MSLTSLLLSLPEEVIALHVFVFLPAECLGRLDAAACQAEHRQGLKQIFSLVTVDIPCIRASQQRAQFVKDV
jgi:hypothetical protein